MSVDHYEKLLGEMREDRIIDEKKWHKISWRECEEAWQNFRDSKNIQFKRDLTRPKEGDE